jgi:2-methylisocitrate lyase-like PEP mutase family enzyme
MPTQAEKGTAFRALHQRDRAFIIPNPWDIGSARLLAHMGFEAVATTSMGYAFSVGKTDGAVGRDEMIAHVREMAAGTDLPVSADLENCYADEPEAAAETIKLAAAAGVVGGSIEDATGHPEQPIYEFVQAVDRVRAAVAAARSLPFTFTLTARAENYLHGRPDLKDTIKRLQAFQEAVAGSSGERADGTARRAADLGRALSTGRPPDQRGQRTAANCIGSVLARRTGNARERNVYFCK